MGDRRRSIQYNDVTPDGFRTRVVDVSVNVFGKLDQFTLKGYLKLAKHGCWLTKINNLHCMLANEDWEKTCTLQQKRLVSSPVVRVFPQTFLSDQSL